MDPLAEPIPDGSYDVLVVSAAEADDATTRLEVTFVTGELKGATVVLRSSLPIDRALDMLALPARLDVADGVPRLTLDR